MPETPHNAWDLLTGEEKETLIEYAGIELECYEDDPSDHPVNRMNAAIEADLLCAAIHTLSMGRRIENDHRHEQAVCTDLKEETR